MDSDQLDGMFALPSGCDELYNAIEKNHVLVFNWFYDTAFGNRPPAGWLAQLAQALTSQHTDAADAAMRAHARYRMP